jgi:hypothetical protein
MAAACRWRRSELEASARRRDWILEVRHMFIRARVGGRRAREREGKAELRMRGSTFGGGWALVILHPVLLSLQGI